MDISNLKFFLVDIEINPTYTGRYYSTASSFINSIYKYSENLSGAADNMLKGLSCRNQLCQTTVSIHEVSVVPKGDKSETNTTEPWPSCQ